MGNVSRVDYVLSRLVWILYLSSLALLPWAWFPPFPWLHEHAQWSDAVFLLAAIAWAAERWRTHQWPSIRPVHVAMALYLGWAAVSLGAAGFEPAVGRWKLLGMAELVVLAAVTTDMASRPGGARAIARVIAGTSLAVAATAFFGVGLFCAGISTQLVGSYGDLVPGSYVRAQAGLSHPNLLASFCIFAFGVVSARHSGLPTWLVRVIQTSLAITVLLTFSRGILAFGLAALIVMAHRPRRRRLAFAYGVVGLCLVAGLTRANLSLDPSRPLAVRIDSSPSSRWQALTTSLETMKRHPFLGSGPGTSPGRKEGQPFDAHMTPVNIAGTLGLPGAFAFLAIPVALWLRRSRPTDRGIWGALAGIGLDALAQDVEDFRHVWVLFGLADAASARNPKKSGAQPESA